MIWEDNDTQRQHLHKWQPSEVKETRACIPYNKLDPVVQWIQEHRKPLLSKHPLIQTQAELQIYRTSLPEKNLREKLIPQPFLTWTKHPMMLGSRPLPRASQKVTCY